MSPRGRPAALLALGLAALLSGCAAFRPAPPPDPAVPATPTTSLEVEGPPALAQLLERHLDVARVGRLAGGEPVDDAEWERLVAAVPVQVRDIVQTEGYFEPKVQVVREGPRALRLVLDPGPLTHVDRVTFDLQGPLQEQAEAGDARAKAVRDALQAAWLLPAGKAFRDDDWRTAKAAALARLRAEGYAAAQWLGTGAEVQAPQHEARVFVVADSGPLFRYGELQVEGLVVHDPVTLRNLAGFDPDMPLTESALLDYQERLQKTGLFDNATVTLDLDPERADAAKVLVHVKEAPIQVWTFGLGVSANTGPRGTVEHVYRRVFGYAATARNRLEWGRDKQSWDGEVSTHALPGLYRNLVGVTISREDSDTDTVLSQRVRVGRAQDKQRFERFYFLEAERSDRTTRATPSTETTTIALSANFQGTWRDLDSLVLPTDGQTLAFQIGAGRAWGQPAEPGFFSRGYGRVTAYRPIGTWFAQARVELGQVFKRDAVAVPESQLFRAGGDESVRGYAYRSLGPVVDGVVSGGDVLFTSSFEIARPVSARLPSVWGAFFVDAGNAANGWAALKPALGIGAGVRWRSPVGPLKLDYAWGRDVHKGRIHFSVGIAY